MVGNLSEGTRRLENLSGGPRGGGKFEWGYQEDVGNLSGGTKRMWGV